MILLIFSGVFIGILLGLTGAGGGILAVPALMVSQGWSVAEASPVGLLAVTLSALIGTIQGFLKKIVRYRAAIWIALLAIPFAHIGVYCSQILPKAWMSFLFACIMTVVAFRLFFNQQNNIDKPLCKLNPQTGKFVWNRKTALILGCIGIGAGFLTGLLGVGGGFIIVPALKKTTSLNLKSIVSTSLMIICLIGTFTIGLHLIDGFLYPKLVTAIFIVACIIGLLVGRILLNKIPAQFVQRVFALTVVGVACMMYFKALL